MTKRSTWPSQTFEPIAGPEVLQLNKYTPQSDERIMNKIAKPIKILAGLKPKGHASEKYFAQNPGLKEIKSINQAVQLIRPGIGQIWPN